MESEAEKQYAAFEEKVKRTVYIDNLSPQVTELIIKTGLEQYGNVSNVRFIPNYSEPNYGAKCALVELENDHQASMIIEMVSTYLFMMCGMPRPVRARPAEPLMFDDRPPESGRTKQWYWLDPNDPGFAVAQKLKDLRRKHLAEVSFLLKKQLEEEEKLSKQQAETLRANYQKYEMVDSVLYDGTGKRLAKHYRMNLGDDCR